MTTRTAIAPPKVNVVANLRELDLETLLALYPTKLEPMPDGRDQLPHFVAIVELLLRWFAAAKRAVAIMGDSFIYYTDASGVVRVVSPDVFIALDVDLDVLDQHRSYFVDLMGKPPAFVLEIGSPSTAHVDLNDKPGIYAEMGASEYWMFDPTGGDYYNFPLRGLRLVEGEYRPIEMTESPDGSVSGHSAALGLEFLWDGSVLHLIDPATGARLRRPEELEVAERAALRRAEEAEARAGEAESELAKLRRMMDSS